MHNWVCAVPVAHRCREPLMRCCNSQKFL